MKIVKPRTLHTERMGKTARQVPSKGFCPYCGDRGPYGRVCQRCSIPPTAALSYHTVPVDESVEITRDAWRDGGQRIRDAAEDLLRQKIKRRYGVNLAVPVTIRYDSDIKCFRMSIKAEFCQMDEVDWYVLLRNPDPTFR